MKIYLVLIATLLVSFNSDASRQERRCQAEDKLTPAEAKGRNDWARSCGHMDAQTYNHYMRNADQPMYDSYYRPYDFYDWFKAPISRAGSCDLGQDNEYTHTLTCVSTKDTDLPPEQNAACEEYRLMSLTQGRITAYDYEYLKATNQVPLFSSQTGRLIGYYACEKFQY
ncbi:hypothetical protein [Pseudoalteromonas luteoviolacea]|uniref:Uncharacterized protein n=1 Tax=Pseudoalteromonas luteoviolacea S4060-1 TaxID=1365257 RepID=A0A167MQG0_9GAMM|nr:hypothetical protein [Pseudoalteromonas luteoviolacea]KZN34892.1 hypothetical protein N480_20095 [Pseudoalteromonas luteoviolacea S2607]KZN66784.1 hypothetical protein N478_18275 [Pseudoalteromonas luteoviolacea S4060-1]